MACHVRLEIVEQSTASPLCGRTRLRVRQVLIDSLRRFFACVTIRYRLVACKISADCHLYFESPQRARSAVLVVRPTSHHQECSLGLPRASVVSLFFRAGCDLCGDPESVYAVLCWPLHVLLRIKIVVLRSCQQSSQFRSSRAKATASNPGTCWSAYRRHLRELGSVSPFFLVRFVTDFRCWPELRAWIFRSARRNST